MRHDVAEYISKTMLDITKNLNESLLFVQQESDENEFKKYRYAVGHVLGMILTDVLNDIYKQYPQLRPSQLNK